MSLQHKNQNTNSVSESIISKVNASASRLMQQAYLCQPHEALMQHLLNQVEKIDFREKAGFEPDNDDSTLKKEHYLVIVVEEVLALASHNKWDLCRREGFFYSYNGAYWKMLGKDDLKAFLRQAAEKMGVDRFKARYVEFSKSLFDQFNETAYLPAPISDRQITKINLQNGTFEISPERQQLRAPDPADFLTHQLTFGYDPTAKAPLFRAFLDRVQPDTDCQKVLAEYLGYVFINPAKLKLEKTLLLYGSGANGKSVFFEIVTALLGSENVSHYSLQSLTTDPGYCRAHLGTKLVNYASEINGKLEADTFKQLVSGEPIEARLPYGQPFIMTNYAKLIFNCNELPTDVEQTHAFFRRFLIVPFNVTIPEKEQDKELAAKIIRSELAGVFNWILEGLRRLLEQGNFTDCAAIRDQLQAYRHQSDSVRLFLDDNDYKADTDRPTFLKDLYREYKQYCIEDGLHPVKKPNFQKRLNAMGIHTERRNIGNMVFISKSDTPY